MAYRIEGLQRQAFEGLLDLCAGACFAAKIVRD